MALASPAVVDGWRKRNVDEKRRRRRRSVLMVGFALGVDCVRTSGLAFIEQFVKQEEGLSRHGFVGGFTL